MTDEEKAEEYAEEHKEVDWEGYDKNKEELKQAFLAGLKAVRQIDQLTKAKEIIREYSKCECEYCDYKRTPDYVTMHCSQCQKYLLHKEAEQFLEEIEK